MSIKPRMFLILGALTGTYLLATYSVLYLAIFPAFEQLELDFANENVERITQALESEKEILASINRDWSEWDDTRRFVTGGDPGYEDRNLYFNALEVIGVNLMTMFDVEGELFWGTEVDLKSGREITQRNALIRLLTVDYQLVGHETVESSATGIITTDLASMIVVSLPILDSVGSGPVAGTLIVGRLLTGELFTKIGERTGVEFTAYSVSEDRLPIEVRAALDGISGSKGTYYQVTETQINSYRLIHDLAGNPALLLQARTPPRITNIGLRTVQIATALIVAAIFLFLAAAWRSINLSLINPLLMIKAHIERIRKTDDLTLRTTDRRKDEWGALALELDALTERLESSRFESERARRAAVAASNAKSDFLARMSHEIRTPMNGVLGMTQLLSSTELSEEQRRYVETIYRSGDSLLGIINDILDFSKIEAGKLALENESFDLRESLEDCVELLAEQADNRGIELVCDMSDDVPSKLRGDVGRIRQVLVNLLGNALKFTDAGEVVLQVTSENRDDALPLFEFQVRDTGVGIRDESLAIVFDSFAQEDETTTRRFGGTGLGLSICRQLVELMRGEIGVESEPGCGSTFWFKIRLKNDREADVPTLDPVPGLRVVVIDDNETARAVVERQLCNWEATVTSFGSGRAALAGLRSGDGFDVILLDQDLPEENSLSVVRDIRALTRFDEPRILMMGFPSDQTNAQEWHARIDGVLGKPIKRSALYEGLTAATPMPASLSKVEAGQKAATANDEVWVLLVEDNFVNQRVARGILEKLGCRVTLASNGREAVEAYSSGTCDLVLMDCQMPEMDGYEATRLIRSHEKAGQLDRTPIVALTANAQAGDREDCLAAGMDDFLSKPFKIDDLAQILAERVKRRTSPFTMGTSPTGSAG